MRTARILEVASHPEVLVALAALVAGEETQQQLLDAIARGEVGRADQATLSRHLARLRDLGIVDKPHRRGTYRLCFPQETASFLTAVVALSQAVTAREDAVESAFLARLRRARLHAVDEELPTHDAPPPS